MEWSGSHNLLHEPERQASSGATEQPSTMALRMHRRRGIADIAHRQFLPLTAGGVSEIKVARHQGVNELAQLGNIFVTYDYNNMSEDVAKFIARCLAAAGRPQLPEITQVLQGNSTARQSESSHSLSHIAAPNEVRAQRVAFDELFGHRINLTTVQVLLVLAWDLSKAQAANDHVAIRRIQRQATDLIARLDVILPVGRRCEVPREPTDDEVSDAQDSDFSASDDGTDDQDDTLSWADDDSDIVVDAVDDTAADGSTAAEGATAADGGATATVSPSPASPVVRAFNWMRDRFMGSG